VRISIYDYGAGLSSLSYLKMLSADELKIDRSLILDVLDSGRDRLIIKFTVDLAHGLGMTVVVGGVGTVEVFDALSARGCDTTMDTGSRDRCRSTTCLPFPRRIGPKNG